MTNKICWVNFTNTLAQSANVVVHTALQKLSCFTNKVMQNSTCTHNSGPAKDFLRPQQQNFNDVQSNLCT